MQVLMPAPGVYAFYAGRDRPGDASDMNWVEDGALSLGIASFALLHNDEAVVYDTHVSLANAGAIRSFLQELGARRIQVVLSHWHLDHVAGTGAFTGCPIIANELTAAHLAERRDVIEAGTLEGPPAIKPLVLPTDTFQDSMELAWTGPRAELHHFDIHSDDGTVLWLPDSGILLAGDTLEDTVTYVGEPHRLGVHLRELDRLRRFNARRILPNHGAAAALSAGGYDPEFITATQSYIRFLQSCRADRSLVPLTLRQVLPRLDGAAAVSYFGPYERVHRQNVAKVRAS